MEEVHRLGLVVIRKNQEIKQLKMLLKNCLGKIKSGKPPLFFDTVKNKAFHTCNSCGAEGWGSKINHKPDCELAKLLRDIQEAL